MQDTQHDREDMSLPTRIAEGWIENAIRRFYATYPRRYPVFNDERREYYKAIEMLRDVRNKRRERWQTLRAEGCTCFTYPGDNGACDRHYYERDDDHRADLQAVQ